MLDYASALAAREGVSLEVACADMVDFTLSRRFDVVVLLMDSSSYLLDNDSVLRHLDCVAWHLTPGGVCVLEMSHPWDGFGVGASNNPHWTSEVDSLNVAMRWDQAGDAFDPVTQIDEVTVTMDWSTADRRRQRPGNRAGPPAPFHSKRDRCAGQVEWRI